MWSAIGKEHEDDGKVVLVPHFRFFFNNPPPPNTKSEKAFQIQNLAKDWHKSLDRKTLQKTDWTNSLWGFLAGVVIIALKIKLHHIMLFAFLIHLLLKGTEYYQSQIVSEKLTKMHTHIDVWVVLLFMSRTDKSVEMSANETSWSWLEISSSVDAEKFW